jgi:hypothetical protein
VENIFIAPVLITGMRITTTQNRFQDVITGMELKLSFEFHYPPLRKDIPMCFAQGIVRPANFSALRF